TVLVARAWQGRTHGSAPTTDERAPGDHVNSKTREPQNKNFAANWICRADPESPVGNRVSEMTPNDVLPTVAIRPGWPRFAWLNRLNTSSRSCARADPTSTMFLMIEKSVLPKP